MALGLVTAVLERHQADGELPPVETANALRGVIQSGSTSPAVGRAQAALGPAENRGGLISFRYLVPLCGVLTLVFGLLYLRDRRQPS